MTTTGIPAKRAQAREAIAEGGYGGTVWDCQESYHEGCSVRSGSVNNVESTLSDDKVEGTRRSSHRRKSSKREISVIEEIMLAMTSDAKTDQQCDDNKRDRKDRRKSSRSRSRRLSRSLSTDSQDLFDDPILDKAERVGDVPTKSSEDKAKPRLRSSHRSSGSSRSSKRVVDSISKSPTRRTKSHSVKSSNGQWTEAIEIPTLWVRDVEPNDERQQLDGKHVFSSSHCKDYFDIMH
jgi:hypothetical protein